MLQKWNHEQNSPGGRGGGDHMFRLALVPWNQAGAICQLSASLCQAHPVSFLQATCPLYKTATMMAPPVGL